mmetsp:Transcript_14657/g.12190  ORF Transcript_14657/g.12190 Transcript_14657/m.12190 type:complete len:140 (+) Transcript_14657:98-517(+)
MLMLILVGLGTLVVQHYIESIVSVILFDDWLSLRQTIAVAVSIIGIVTYSTLRIRYAKEEADREFEKLPEVPDDDDDDRRISITDTNPVNHHYRTAAVVATTASSSSLPTTTLDLKCPLIITHSDSITPSTITAAATVL